MRMFRTAVLPALLAVVPAAAHATILNFDALPGGGVVSSGYGDRVAGPDPAWGYVEGNGWTPNVSVGFDTLKLDGNEFTVSGLRTWGLGYGDLSVVAFPGAQTEHAGIFTFTPDAGYRVRINSFLLAGFPAVDYDGQPILVTDASFNVLWDGGSHVEGSNLDGGGFPDATHSTFAPGITYEGTVYLIFGNNWNIGIDEIDFDQVAVPEPGTLGLAGVGLALLAAVSRGRRRD